MSKQQTTPLTPAQKEHWNDFIDYMKKTGNSGKTALDNRNMALGQNLLQKFNSAAKNPADTIGYEDIAKVQKELQDSRAVAVANYKKNPTSFVGAKSEDDIMKNLSPVDGWLGSKTSLHKFPVAMEVKYSPNTKPDTTNYGTDLSAYNNNFNMKK